MGPSQLVKEGIPTIRQTGQVAGVERVTRMGGAALLVPEFLAVQEQAGVYLSVPESSFSSYTNEATGKNEDEVVAAYRL